MGTIAESPRPMTRRRSNTRQRLVAAALVTFAERGYHGASVEDVCDQAGFTRGAFYSNFGSKEELFLEVHAVHTKRMIDALAEAVRQLPATTGAARPDTDASAGGTSAGGAPGGGAPGGGAPGGGAPAVAVTQAVGATAEREAFAATAERYLAAQPVERQWYLVNAEFTLHALRHPELAKELAARRREMRRRAAELITRALAEVGLEPRVDGDALARAVVALHTGSLEQSFLEPDEVPIGHLERGMLPALLQAASRPIASE